MGQFFKMFPNSSQNWLKFKKISEKLGYFGPPKIGPIGMSKGHIFL